MPTLSWLVLTGAVLPRLGLATDAGNENLLFSVMVTSLCWAYLQAKY